MSFEKIDPVLDNPVPAPTRGQAPIYRRDSTAGRWLDSYLDAGLVGYWPFDGPHLDGSTVLDASGDGRDGTLNGDPTTGVSGVLGQAMEFDGSGDYVEATDTADGLGQLTLSAWVNPSTLPSNSSPIGHGDAEYVVIGELGDANDIFGLTVADGGTAFYIDNGDNNSLVGDPVPTNEWTHIAAVYDGSEQMVYINGEKTASASVSGSLASSSANAKIGGGHIATNCHFDGLIDSPRVYDRGLDEDEISALYQQGRPVSIPGRAAHWILDRDQLDNGVLLEASGAGFDGTMSGGVTTGVDSPTGEAFRFDGTDDEIDTGFTYDGGAVTQTMWMRPNSPVNNSVSGQHDGSNNGRFYLGFDDETSLQTGYGGSSRMTSTPYDPSDKWVFLAMTVDSSENVTVYVDAEQVDTFSDTFGSTSNSYLIGSIAASDHRVDGEVADVRIYNRELSEAELHDLYHSSRIVDPAGRLGHWTLNERHTDSGETEDISPWSRTGTLSGGVSTGVSSPVGQGFQFDGVDDMVKVGSAGLPGGSFSISHWVKKDAGSSGGYPCTAAETGAGGAKYRGFKGTNNGQTMRFTVFEPGSGSFVTADESSYSGTLDTWTHYVGVCDLSAMEIRLYKDGSLDDTTALGEVPEVYSDFTMGMREGDGDTTSEQFAGGLSDVRWYDRVLSLEEIQALHQLGI